MFTWSCHHHVRYSRPCIVLEMQICTVAKFRAGVLFTHNFVTLLQTSRQTWSRSDGSQSGGKGLKKPYSGPLFSKKNWQVKGKLWPSTLWLLLWGSTIDIITPMRKACPCGRVLAPGRTGTPSAPKQWKLNVHVKGLNSVSARSSLNKSKKKK